MSLLLNRNEITISRPSDEVDEHGWALGAADVLTEVDVVQGSIQWTMPASENSMTTDGAGPFDPAITFAATAYLPPDCGVQPGDVLTTDGYPDVVVQSCVLIQDPRATGELDCIQASVSQVKQPVFGDES